MGLGVRRLDDQRVTIETPEHVTLSYELAGAGSRMLAAVFDHLLVAVFILGTALLAYALSPTPLVGQASPVVVAVLFGGPLLVLVVYYVAFEMAWGGQTPGKRAAGLRVMRDDGTPITALEALIRNALRVIDFLPYLYFVGGTVSFFHPQGKRLGDLAARTVVVKVRESEIPQVAAPAGRAADLPVDDLTALVRGTARQLSPEEAATVDRFIERRLDLAPDVRRQMAERVLATLRDRLPEPAVEAAAGDPEAVLEAVLRARTQVGERF